MIGGQSNLPYTDLALQIALSKRDKEDLAAIDAKTKADPKVAMTFTGQRSFKH